MVEKEGRHNEKNEKTDSEICNAIGKKDLSAKEFAAFLGVDEKTIRIFTR